MHTTYNLYNLQYTVQCAHCIQQTALGLDVVPSQDILYVFLLKPSFHYELTVAIYRPASSQLSEQEG